MIENEKITVPKIINMKQKGNKIVCLTAYDWTFATILDKSGIDIILVGDSGGMVSAGYETTLPVTMNEMLLYTKSVVRGVKQALVVADMPFLSYQADISEAVRNSGMFLKEAGADAVKLEGGEYIAETVNRIVQCGIPVMGHLGLTPQSIRSFGGYSLRGSEKKEAEKMMRDAVILEQAGVFAIVLEKIPSDLARQITESVAIPTIGIGAGPHCDGQILVTHDLLGLFESFRPKFVRRYANLADTIESAVSDYSKDVKSGKFPNKKESF
ncbi:3-methyl-2-oxobutanoate hydroxymethyltransferase [bacterium]|nr:3-methyl-2-oxobutanoate hydroxymethyltransferase [bacterium]